MAFSLQNIQGPAWTLEQEKGQHHVQQGVVAFMVNGSFWQLPTAGKKQASSRHQ